MRKILAALIFVVLLVFLYKTRARVPFYDFSPPFNPALIATINPDSLDVFKFDFCKVINSNFNAVADWDSVVFVPPYLDSSLIWKLGLKNFWSVWWDVFQLAFDDSINTVLFVKDKRIIAYGTVYQWPLILDYTKFKSQLPVVPIIKRSYCPDMYLQRRRYEEQLYYQVVIRKAKFN